MGLACRIRKDNKGNIREVLNTKGEPSRLFDELLSVTRNADKALSVWAMHSLEGVQKMYGFSENPDDFRASDLLEYYDSKKAIDTKVSPEDIFDAKTIMRRKGITSLSAFVSKLKDIFYTNGELNFDADKAVSSGLYSPQDVLTVDVTKVKATIAKLEEEASINDFTIEDTTEDFVYFDPNVKTAFGTSTPVSSKELADEWIDSIENFSNREEVLAKLEALPYPDFVAQMVADFDLMFERISRMQRVDTLQIKNGKLQLQTSDTNSTVTNTIRNNINTQELEEELKYVDDILPTVWQETQQDVKGVLKEIEEVAVKEGIDIIGLSNLVASKTKVMELLAATVNMAKNPTQENIDIFSEVHDRLIPKMTPKEIMKFGDNLRGKKIVRVFSNLSANEMFEQYNLIEIAPNLYHRVKNNESIEDLYDILRRRIGKPEAAPKELQAYLSEQRPKSVQRMAIYQELFEHPKRVESKEDVEFLEGIVENEEYLKTDFVADLYQYVLEQKLANTPLYNKVLKHIKFTEQDISIETPIEDMQNTEYFKELTDYLRLRKNTNGKQFIPKELKSTPTQTLVAVNNPQSFPPYQEYILTRGNLVATKPQQQNILRIGEDVYQQIATNNNVSVYAKLKKNTNPLYYTTKVEKLPYDQKQVQKLLEEDLAPKTTLAEKQKQAGLLSPMMEKLREKATNLVAKVGNPVMFSVGETSQKFDGQANFERWRGNGKLVQEGEIQNVKTGEAVVVKAFHGTTNEFYEFDSSVKGNIEGHLGKVNYFTSDYQDASQNYLSQGADITSRVENIKERLLSELEYRVDESLEEDEREDRIREVVRDLYPDFDTSSLDFNMELFEVADRVASSLLIGGEEIVLDVFVKLNNPVVLGSGSTWFETLNVSENDLEQAAQEIADENDITVEEAKEDYEWDVRERAIENSGYENLAVEALSDALNSNGYDGAKAGEILGDNLYESEIDLNKLEKDLREAELYENEEGELASSQVIADFFKNLGFDGIILTDVSNRFPNMGLSPSTSHIHVFDEYNNQIKLADGSNVLFGETSDIRYQMGQAPTQTDATFNQNLVDFIRSKGVTVITDLKTITEKLNKIGIDSVNAEAITLETLKIKKKGDRFRVSSKGKRIDYIYGPNYPQYLAERDFRKDADKAREKLKELLGNDYQSKYLVESFPMLQVQVPQNIEDKVAPKKVKTKPKTVPQTRTDGMPNLEERNRLFILNELKRGVDLDTLEDIGYKFLQTPKGNILGFEHNGTIYLDPTQLNTITTLHELVHVYQSILDIKAQKGGLTAREIISKRKELFQEEADFWKEYHKNRVGTGQGNQMITGEVGATNLDLADRTNVRMNNLTVARQMESEGRDAKTIRLATGWERGADGKWKYEISDINIVGDLKPFQEGYQGEGYVVSLGDFVEGELLTAYPELRDKVTIVRGLPTSVDFGVSGALSKTKGGWDLYLSDNIFNGDLDFGKSVLLHEIQHVIQNIEGFAIGGNTRQMTTPNDALQEIASPFNFPKLGKDARAIAKQKTRERGLRFSEIFYFDVIKDDPDIIEDLIERLEILNEVSPNDSYTKLIDALDYKLMEMGGGNVAFEKYKKLAGEVEARNVQKRANLSPKQRRLLALAETEDVAREDQIIMFQAIQNYNTELSALGIDLTSDVYAKRKGETDTEYNDRLLKEIEAYVTAPQMAEKLENLRKENPTLWQKLKDFISQLSNYLKTQLGLQDYQGNIMNLTKEQYLEALGVSVLKDEYGSLRDVNYKLRDPENNTLIFVNPAKLLERLSLDDPDFDVQRKENQIGNRVEKAKTFLREYLSDQRWLSPRTGERTKSEVTFEPSIVGIYNNKLGFTDGRHRVLAAKELGLTEVGIEVPKNQVALYQNMTLAETVSEATPNFETAKNSASLNRVLLDSNVQILQELTEEEELDLYNEVDNCTL
jgi:hypothetical protein